MLFNEMQRATGLDATTAREAMVTTASFCSLGGDTDDKHDNDDLLLPDPTLSAVTRAFWCDLQGVADCILEKAAEEDLEDPPPPAVAVAEKSTFCANKQRELLQQTGAQLLAELQSRGECSAMMRSTVALRHQIRSELMLLVRQKREGSSAAEDVATLAQSLLQCEAATEVAEQISMQCDDEGGFEDAIRGAAQGLLKCLQQCTAPSKAGAADLLFSECDQVRDVLAESGVGLDDPCACGKRGGGVR
jgi:hypothetical protein